MPFARSIPVALLLLVLAAAPADAATGRSSAPASAAPPPAASAASGVEPVATGAGRLEPGAEPGPGALGLLSLAAGLAALLVGATWAVRRWPPTSRWLGRPGAVRVLARAPLGPRHALCLVDAFGVGVLLALHPQGSSVVHVWPDGLPEAGAPRVPPTAEARPGAPPGQLAALVEAVRRRRGSS